MSSKRKFEFTISYVEKESTKTILFTTHNIETAIEIGDRIGIIKNGKIIDIRQAKDLNKTLIESFY